MSEEQPVPPSVPQPPQVPAPPAYPQFNNGQPVSYPQGYPVQQAPQGQTSLPLLALIFGIGGFFFSLLCSIPAIILGVMGRKKAKELNQPTSMATAGLVLGIISTIWAILSIALFLLIIVGSSNTSEGTWTDKADSLKVESNVAAIANVVKNGQGVGDIVRSDGTTVSYSGETGQQSIELGTATINKTIITMDSTWCIQDSGDGYTWHMTEADTAPQQGACSS